MVWVHSAPKNEHIWGKFLKKSPHSVSYRWQHIVSAIGGVSETRSGQGMFLMELHLFTIDKEL